MAATEIPVCDFGLKAPDFALPDSDGRVHALHDLMGENGLLVMFICNHCPFVKAVLGKIVRDAAELVGHGINSVGIMPNDITAYPEDSPQNMKKVASQNAFTFPYLYDESQAVAKAYGAVCTPDFFGYNRQFELHYRGRIDAAGIKVQEGLERELFEAMKQIANEQKGPAKQTPGIGCSIKWK